MATTKVIPTVSNQFSIYVDDATLTDVDDDNNFVHASTFENINFNDVIPYEDEPTNAVVPYTSNIVTPSIFPHYAETFVSDNMFFNLYYDINNLDHPNFEFVADPTAYKVVNIPNCGSKTNVPSLKSLCNDFFFKKRNYCDSLDDFDNYCIQFRPLSKLRYVDDIAGITRSRLLSVEKCRGFRCCGCGASVNTFKSIEDHVNYHMNIMRPLSRDSLWFDKIVSCEVDTYYPVRRIIRELAYNRQTICQYCRCYFNSFSSVHIHYQFHNALCEAHTNTHCHRCGSRFDSNLERLQHFWSYRDARYGDKTYRAMRVEMCEPHQIFSNTNVLDLAPPLTSVCDIRSTREFGYSDHSPIWCKQFTLKRLMWSKYKRALKRMRKNDSGKMLANLLRVERKREIVNKLHFLSDALFDAKTGMTNDFARFRDALWPNDTEPQFFDGNSLFGFNFSVFPKNMFDSLCALMEKLYADLKNWISIVWNWICKHYKTFGLIALFVAILIVWKITSIFGATSREVVISGSAMAFALMCYYDTCQAEDMANQVVAIVDDLKRSDVRFHFGEVGNDLTNGSIVSDDMFEIFDRNPGVLNDTESQLGNDDNDALAMTSMLAKFLKLQVDPTQIKHFISINRISYNMASGLRSWTYIVDWIKTVSVKLMDAFYGTATERAVLSFEEMKDTCRKWIAEINDLDSEESRKAISYDEIYQKRALKVRDVGSFLLEQSIVNQKTTYIRSAINVLLKTARELAELAEKSILANDMRADPWLIWLYGSPGIGKSAAVQLISNMLLEGYDERIKNRTYAINGSLKHMDGYKSQPLVLIDDFLTMADSQHETESLDIFMKCKSSTCYQVPMADISSKGKLFDSPLMFVTSNQLYPNIDTRVHSTEAVYRRRNALWHAEFKPQYREKSLHEIPLQVTMKMEHLQFQRYHPIEVMRKIGLPVAFSEFIEQSRRDIAAHFVLQGQLLRRAKQYVPMIIRHKRNKRVLAGDFGDVTRDIPEFINFDDYNDTEEQGRTVYFENESLHADRIPAHVVIVTASDEEEAMTGWKKGFREANILFQGAALQLLKCVEMCDKWFDKIVDYLKLRPALACVCGFGIGAAAFTGIRALMNSVFGTDTQSEMSGGASGAYKTKFMNKPVIGQRRYAARKVQSEDGKTLQLTPVDIQAEGCFDQNAMELMYKRLPWNLFDITKLAPDGTGCTMRATSLAGRILILPAHFFIGMNDKFQLLLSDGVTTWTEFYNPDRLVLLDDENGQLDIAAYEMGPTFPMQRKLCTHFISERELGRIGNAEGTLLHRVYGFSGVADKSGIWGMSAKVTPIDQHQGIYYDVNKNGEAKSFTLRTGWNFHGPTKRGDCGSLLIIHSPHVKGKIVGMHVAGSRSKTLGYSMVVTQEMVEELMRQCTTRGMSVEPPPNDVFDQGAEFRFAPIGNFTPIGVVKPEFQVHQPTKTAIAPSLIFDKVREHVCEPAVLKENDPRNLSGESPLLKGISKYGSPSKPFPERLVKFAGRETFMTYANLDWPATSNEIDMQWILHGSGDGSNAINLNTSPGHPWVCNKPKGAVGKHWLIENDGSGNCKMTEQMRSAVISRLLKYSKRQRPFSMWIDCKKDEIRPIEKIRAGKTRIFTIAPADFTIVCRMFFLHFIEAFQKNNCNGFSAVGLDPLVDWERMLKRMEEVGKNFAFDGDFGTYDGKLKPGCIAEAIEGISDWYDMHVDGLVIRIDGQEFKFTPEECRMIRRLICDEIIHTIQLAKDCGYQSHMGNPSGNPLTAVLNSIVNEIYLRIVFYICVGRCKLGEFDNAVREEVYGDDNIVNVREDYKEVYNFQTVSKVFAEYDIEYTTAAKGDGAGFKYKPLSELRFLKQGIGLYKNVVRVPLMAMDTIYELTNWVSTKMPPADQLYDNLDCAMRYIMLYGKQDFELFKDSVNRALHSVGLQKIFTDYSALCMELDDKLGLV